MFWIRFALLIAAHRSPIFSRERPHAFTLFELLLAMAVFAGAAALVMPTIGGLLTDRRIIRASDQVRAEIIRLRVHAMRQGRVMKLEVVASGEPDGGSELRVSSVFSSADSMNSASASGGQAALMSGANQTIGAIGTAMTVGGEESWVIELPEGTSVKSIITSPAGGAASIEAAALTTGDSGAVSGNQSGNLSITPAVYFYPTGQTSNAIVTLTDGASPDRYLQVRGLTGDVSAR